MSQEKLISVLLVDKDLTTLALVENALPPESFEIFQVRTGEEAYTRCQRRVPDIIITEALLPGIDGYNLTRNLRQNPSTHSLPILMLTVKNEIGDKIAGFEAGVDDYLAKPFQPQELVYRVRNLVARAHLGAPAAPPQARRGRVITIFGTKGGVGKTTLAVNLAVALKQRTKARVVLVDADFFFGNIPLHLSLSPTTTMLDLIDRMDQLDAELVNRVLITHTSGIRVLLSPTQPEEAERVSALHIEKILQCLSGMCDFVLVDCHPNYDDRNLSILEQSDEIMFVVRPEIGPLKNMGVFFNLALKLGLNLSNIHIVLNRAGSQSGIEVEQIEHSFRSRVEFRMSSGGRTVVQSLNRGVPLMIDKPDHPLSKQIAGVADFLAKPSHNGHGPVKRR